ncbi:MAG TPA: metallophosphoesterase [Vicinamibacteria bacterium]
MRSAPILLALAAIATPASPQSAVQGHVAGLVFEDRNQDGSRDPGEPGIQGVSVCTRSDCALTDAEGLYEVEVRPGYQVAWVSQPDGYAAVRGFHRRIPEDPFEWLVNFPLERREPVSSFSFLHASDTHVDAESLPRMQRLREIATERGVDFVIITGDLVRDALRVSEKVARERFDLFKKEKDAFPMPVWVVPGNHEIFGIERHKSGVAEDHPLYGKAMYERILGPTYYSFDFGGVHFVGLDTADVDDRWYYGHVDATQLAWLEKDLARVSAETPIVTFNHVPLFSALVTSGGYDPEGDGPGSVIEVDGKPQYRHVVSNFAEVLRKFEGKNYPLALGGHIHAREEMILGDPKVPTRFHQTGAVIGPGGVPGLNLVSGVTLYRVKDKVIEGHEFIAIDKAN